MAGNDEAESSDSLADGDSCGPNWNDHEDWELYRTETIKGTLHEYQRCPECGEERVIY